MKGKSERRRKRYWLDPKLQAGFIIRLLLLCALLATILAWSVLYVVWAPLLDRIDWSASGAQPQELFVQAAARVLATTILLILAFSIVAFGVGLVFSHRVAGPAHRLSRLLRRAAEGQYDERATVRRKDCLQELVTAFNEMLDAMEKQSQERRVKLETVRRVLVKLEDLTRSPISDAETVRGHVALLERHVKDLWETGLDRPARRRHFQLVGSNADADVEMAEALSRT